MNPILSWLGGSGLLLLTGILGVLGYRASHKHDKKISEQGNTTIATLLMERMEAMLTRQDVDLREIRVELLAAHQRNAVLQAFVKLLQADMVAAGLTPRPYPDEL